MEIAKRLSFVLCILFSLHSIAQKPDANWNKWNWIVGEWVGEGNGQPGQGEGKFTFRFDLDNNVLVREAFSEYPATKDKPAIMHKDLMIVYRDLAGVPNKAIYFDNENHVINYTVTISEKSIVFLSEKLANMPIFRLTYIFINDESVSIKFEMSQDGVSFSTYIEGTSKRKK